MLGSSGVVVMAVSKRSLSLLKVMLDTRCWMLGSSGVVVMAVSKRSLSLLKVMLDALNKHR
jgi:hypothetical protein